VKAYNLEHGDKFKLAGDDNSPIFEFHHHEHNHAVVYYSENKITKMVSFFGLTPVIIYKEKEDG